MTPLAVPRQSIGPARGAPRCPAAWLLRAFERVVSNPLQIHRAKHPLADGTSRSSCRSTCLFFVKAPRYLLGCRGWRGSYPFERQGPFATIILRVLPVFRRKSTGFGQARPTLSQLTSATAL